MSRISTVMCAPIYTERIGLETEVFVGPEVGIQHPSSVRCDLITLLFKTQLSRRVGQLTAAQKNDLRRALVVAFDLQV